MHAIHPYLLRRTIKVAVVGCGGTGSALVGGLPHLHQALIACGHPSGLAVTVIDGDRISAANCVRQPFSASEIGLFKSVMLINRLNLFWGLDWQAVPQHLGTGHDLQNDLDLVIGCVDSRAARAKIHGAVSATWCGIGYCILTLETMPTLGSSSWGSLSIVPTNIRLIGFAQFRNSSRKLSIRHSTTISNPAAAPPRRWSGSIRSSTRRWQTTHSRC
jgi:hypothetical protein